MLFAVGNTISILPVDFSDKKTKIPDYIPVFSDPLPGWHTYLRNKPCESRFFYVN